VTVAGVDLSAAVQNGRATPRLLAVQPLLYGALLVGFRHIIRVPAALPANWVFKLGWREETRRYLSGARTAALVSLVLPALAVTFPLMAFALGPVLAAAHAAMGLAGALLLLEVLMIGYSKVPFTCTYVPAPTLRVFAPVYVVMFLAGAQIYARIESAALASFESGLTLIGALLGSVAIIRVTRRWRARTITVDFDEAPSGVQRLSLHG
jgi:hypothetical protein